MSDLEIVGLVLTALALGVVLGGVVVGGWRMAGARRDHEENVRLRAHEENVRLRARLAALLTDQGTPTVPWEIEPGNTEAIVRAAGEDAWAEHCRTAGVRDPRD
jgi:hypothetical protein